MKKTVAIDVVKFLLDHHVPHATSGSSTCRPRWVQIHCPFCPGAPDWHLGYNLQNHYWNCWRCGSKQWEAVARTIGGLSWTSLQARYGTLGGGGTLTPTPRAKSPVTRQRAALPDGCGPLGPHHRRYLRKRGYDPTHLEQLWGLQGTGPVAFVKLDKKLWDYKLRIIAPIRHNKKIVSFQGRDITDKARAKYLACPGVLEARPIKHCLYGLEKVDPSKGCVVVEGITDVWRLGPGAVATFGTAWVPEQAYLLSRMPWVGVMFDGGEPDARKFSESLCALLTTLGIQTEQLDLKTGDPGALDQTTANNYMQELELK